MNKLIIGITGPIATGKGTCADFFIKNHNAVSFRFSSSLFEILEILGLPVNRDNLSRLSKDLREEFGQNVLAVSLASKVRKSEAKIIVVDGIRRPDDIVELSKIEGFKLVYLDAPIETRFERMKIRGEKEDDATKTFEEFKKDHEYETELLIPELKKDASLVIDNSGSLEELYAQLEALIQE